MGKLNKLNLNMFDGVTEEKYNSKKSEYIAASKEYIPGGLFSIGCYRSTTEKGKLEWENMYPDGFNSWKAHQWKLNAYGSQDIIDKINEIIDALPDSTNV